MSQLLPWIHTGVENMGRKYGVQGGGNQGNFALSELDMKLFVSNVTSKSKPVKLETSSTMILLFRGAFSE